MGFWTEIFKSALNVTLRSTEASDDVKIQVRNPGEIIWRDFTFVASNAESVQNGLNVASSAYPNADVRALDSRGRMVDFI